MSLELAAQHLASRGRKGDSMLVHMAPEEVSGLQALARAGGGTLTLNPDTGLPEANFLKRMLPMIIGAGITAATGGAAAPWMIGLGLGGAETIRTGSLEKGLMAGLGAYGGAGLAGGLAAAGAASPTAAAQALGTPAATGAGSQAAMLAGQNAGFGQAGIDALASSAGTAAGAAPVATNVFSAGANALGTEAGRSAALSSMGGGMQAAKYGLAAATPMMQPDAPAPFDGGGPNPYEYNYDPNNQMYTRVPPGSRQRDFLAPITPMLAVGGAVEGMSDIDSINAMMASSGQTYAAGGVSHLGDYSDGGRLLKGPGDGVSDSIPATIANKRPARLADGEFVVPARIVSELGNGSTEAGARKLYAMMDRVQKARGKTTGKNRVAVNSRTDKLLPA
jgi:hypothetical protein